MVAKIEIISIMFLLLAQQVYTGDFDTQTQKLAKMSRKIAESEDDWERGAVLMVDSIADVVLSIGCSGLKRLMAG